MFERRLAGINFDAYTALAGAGLAAMVITARDDGFVICPYRRCTGGYCPGCGATRAANRLLVGDVSAAWNQHPMTVLLGLQAVGVIAAVLWGGRAWLVRHQAVIVTLNVMVLIAVWVIRTAMGSVPTPTIFS